ncbi:MAG: hypothetical protein HY701_15035 [Gemmatimonadetes bacterium]|nr:hypothetical protein [Gemmatimonadota bacterium]
MTPTDPLAPVLDASTPPTVRRPAPEDPMTDREGEGAANSASDRGDGREGQASGPHLSVVGSTSVAGAAPAGAAERERCRATTTAGRQCTNRVLHDGEGLCYTHSERRAAQRADARSRGGKTTAETRKGQGQTIRFRSPAEIQRALERGATAMVAGKLSPTAYMALVRAAELLVKPNPAIQRASFLAATKTKGAPE